MIIIFITIILRLIIIHQQIIMIHGEVPYLIMLGKTVNHMITIDNDLVQFDGMFQV